VSKAKQIDWRSVKPSPIVFVFGNEDYFATRAIRSVREQLKSKDSSLEVTEIEASDYTAGQIFDLTAPSLFGEPRLLIVRALERLSDPLLDDAMAYINAPPDDVTVIFRHNNSSVRAKKLIEALRANDKTTVVLCDKLAKDNEKSAFVTAEFSAQQRKISNGAVRALVEAFNDDVAELAAACEQLIQDSAESITEEIVDNYYGGRVETTTFKLADTCMAGQEGEALAILRHLMQTGADPVMILGGLATKVRQVAKVHGAESAASAQAGMQPWLAEKIRRDAHQWSEGGIVNAVTAVAQTDSAIKGGSRDSVFALETLVRLISKRGLD
jgi:DNA polymerase-3 subunit delta